MGLCCVIDYFSSKSPVSAIYYLSQLIFIIGFSSELIGSYFTMFYLHNLYIQF